LVVHDPNEGIVYPVKMAGHIFAVVNIKNKQYKVVENDVLVISNLDSSVDINQ